MLSLSEFNPVGLVLIGLLNPLVIVVAIALGRSADQWQKIVVAAFAASLVGIIGVWVVTRLGLMPASGFGGTGGLFIVQIISGLLWAGGAYALKRRQA